LNEKQAAASKLGSGSTLLQSNGRISLLDWTVSFSTNSYLTVVNILQNKRKNQVYLTVYYSEEALFVKGIGQ